MINVASKDLCAELHKLSGWSDTVFCWNGALVPSWWPPEMRTHEVGSSPAYDLGYMLRKLREAEGVNCQVTTSGDIPTMNGKEKGKWLARAWDMDGIKDTAADTPEDALAKLAIELFEYWRDRE